MTVRGEAARVSQELAAAGVPDSRFEAELLARAAAGLTRSAFFTDPELDAASAARLGELTARRLQREPFAYIVGKREFFGLEFIVGPGVLIPRPETELLVDAVLEELRTAPAATVIDVGAGSGAVALSIALSAPEARVAACDCSADALAIARQNRDRLAPRVPLIRGHLAAAIREAEIVVANLPYIPTDVVATLEPEIRDWEPLSALDGGPDGLDLIRQLVDDCAARLRPRLLALEVAEGQAPAVLSYGERHGARGEIRLDLAGIERAVLLRWR